MTECTKCGQLAQCIYGCDWMCAKCANEKYRQDNE